MMHSFAIRFVLLLVFLNCATCHRQLKFLEKSDDTKPLPYQEKFEQLFRAFERNDTKQMEEIFEFLKNIITNDSIQENSTEYKDNGLTFVVRLKHEFAI